MELRMIIGPDLTEWIDCAICYVYPEPVLDGCVKLMQGQEGMQTILEIHGPDAERLKP